MFAQLERIIDKEKIQAQARFKPVEEVKTGLTAIINGKDVDLEKLDRRFLRNLTENEYIHDLNANIALSIAAAHINFTVMSNIVNGAEGAEKRARIFSGILALLRHGHGESLQDFLAQFELGELGNYNAKIKYQGVASTLLDVACKTGNVKAVRFLLEKGCKITELSNDYDPQILKLLLTQDQFPLLPLDKENEEAFNARVKKQKESLLVWIEKIDAKILEILLDDKSIDVSQYHFSKLIASKNYEAASVFIEKRRDLLETGFLHAIFNSHYQWAAGWERKFLAGVPDECKFGLQHSPYLYQIPFHLFITLPLFIKYNNPALIALVPLTFILCGLYNQRVEKGFLAAVEELGKERTHLEEEEIVGEVVPKDKNAFIAHCLNGDVEEVNRKLGEEVKEEGLLSALATTVKTAGGLTGIHIAIQTQNLELLKCFTPADIMAVVDDKGLSAFATLLECKKNLEFDKDGALLNHFFDFVFKPKHIDSNGRTPLHIAAIYGNRSALNKACKADYSKAEDLKPIFRSLIGGNKKALDEFLSACNYYKIDTNPYIEDALNYATSKFNSWAVKAILSHVPSIDPKYFLGLFERDTLGFRDVLLGEFINAGINGKFDLNAKHSRGNWLDNLRHYKPSSEIFSKPFYSSQLWSERLFGFVATVAILALAKTPEDSVILSIKSLLVATIVYDRSTSFYDKYVLKPALEVELGREAIRSVL